jgi:chromosomal replication initiator protein
MKDKIHPYIYAGLDRSDKVKNELKIDSFFNAVHELYDLSKEDVVAKTRIREIVDIRRMGMYYLRHTLGMTTSRVGQIMGNKDHATVLYNTTRARELFEIEPSFKKRYRAIMSKMMSKEVDVDVIIKGDTY